MPVERALLLLADIVGYTTFMRLHRMSLAHSQDITGRLLESMVDAVPSLRLVEVEGDALFLYAAQAEIDRQSASDATLGLVLAMHRAFHARQQTMVARNMCACDACRQTGQLRVKFVAHLGEVATQTIKNRTKLVGIDVIAAHRMLKNSVPVPEYILMSDSIYEDSGQALRERSVRLDQELEGVGTMTSYFVDLEGIALEPPALPTPALLTRLGETLGRTARCLPHMVGARKLRPPADAEAI